MMYLACAFGGFIIGVISVCGFAILAVGNGPRSEPKYVDGKYPSERPQLNGEDVPDEFL